MTVVMDKNKYITVAIDHLMDRNTYNTMNSKIEKCNNNSVTSLLNNKYIDKNSIHESK